MEIALPSQPPLLARVLATFSDPCADVHSMADALKHTPELAHAFVRLANTFGRRGRVSCVANAILELGPRASTHVIMCLATKKHLSATGSHRLALDNFWLGSLRRACAAYTIAGHLGLNDELSLFSMGFHQDVGVLLRAQQDPSGAETLTALAGAPALRRLHAERTHGTTHDEVSFRFCRGWSLPADVAVPIRYHHHPDDAPAVYAAGAAIGYAGESVSDLAGSVEVPLVWDIAEEALANLRLHGLLAKVFDDVADLVDDTAESFGIDAVPAPRFRDTSYHSLSRPSGFQRRGSAAQRALTVIGREDAQPPIIQGPLCEQRKDADTSRAPQADSGPELGFRDSRHRRS